MRIVTFDDGRGSLWMSGPLGISSASLADLNSAADGNLSSLSVLSYGTGGGYAPLREVLAQRHGVEPGRVYLTTGGLQGFVFYTAVQLAVRPGRVERLESGD